MNAKKKWESDAGGYEKVKREGNDQEKKKEENGWEKIFLSLVFSYSLYVVGRTAGLSFLSLSLSLSLNGWLTEFDLTTLPLPQSHFSPDSYTAFNNYYIKSEWMNLK